MGEIKPIKKPLQVNPLKLSQPMGATLAFLGVDCCMPLLHGGQGCASFTKVFMTRHFCEPIALQTTAVTDVTAVLDGGDYSIAESVKNIYKKGNPSLIGLYTTGLPETKGDDIRGVASRIDCPLVHVNTADYEGGFESGWGKTCKALIEQLVEPKENITANKVVLLPHVSLQPIEVEKVKDFIAAFGFEVFALPDISTSLDGHLGEKQAALSCGGITLDEIISLGDAALVISIGASMEPSAAALQKKNTAMRHHHVAHLGGLQASDALTSILLAESGLKTPPTKVVRWRQRLQDALLDSHFAIGQTRFLVTAEPDQLASICDSLYEAGGQVTVAVSPVKSSQLDNLQAQRIIVGDLEDAEKYADEYDVVIGSFHVEALAHRHHKPAIIRGFPNWEQVGNQLKNDTLYEGGAYFLFEVANVVIEHQAALEKKKDAVNH
jgi:nitrogenase molybdenum-iron protein NifN